MTPAARERIGILGAGPTTLFLLAELLSRKETRYDIIIYEADNVVGCGKAFNYQYSYPGLLSNITKAELPALPLEFDTWLTRNSPVSPYNNDRVLPRSVLGQYLSDNFWAVVERLRAMGVAIALNCNRRVIDTRGSKGAYEIITDDGDIEPVTTLIINTGPVVPNDWRKPGVYPPYPVYAYDDPTLSHFQIIGTSLTAIDVVIGIAQLRGHFVRPGQHLLYSSDTPLTITMQSPSGLLPQPWFSMANKQEYVTFMEGLALPAATSLDRLYRHICLPVYAEFAPYTYQQIKQLSFEGALKLLAGKKAPINAMAKLHCELIGSRQLPNENWPAILEAFCEFIERFAANLPDSEIRRYHRSLRPLVASCTGAIPLPYCEKLFALIRSNVLSVQAESYQVALKGSEKNVRADMAIVDCRGFPGPLVSSFPLKALTQLERRQQRDRGAEQAVRRTSPYFELLLDNETSGIYVGSPHLLPSVFSLPGLDNCARIAMHIADGLTFPPGGLPKAV